VDTGIPAQYAPDIKSDFSIKASQDGNTIQINGAMTLFPSVEIKVGRDGNVQTLVSVPGAASGPGLTTLGPAGKQGRVSMTFNYDEKRKEYVQTNR
jgi:hypothetical protein